MNLEIFTSLIRLELADDGSSYVAYWKNDTLLGEIYMEIDGYYVFEPRKGNGYWSETVLLAIGFKLRELNARWDAHIQKEIG